MRRASARSKSESLTSLARKPLPGEQTPPTGRVGTAALTAFWSTCHRLCRCSCSAQLCLPDYSAVAAQRWDCRWAILDYLAKRQRSARCPRPRSDWSEEYLAKRQSSGRCSRPDRIGLRWGRADRWGRGENDVVVRLSGLRTARSKEQGSCEENWKLGLHLEHLRVSFGSVKLCRGLRTLPRTTHR